MNQGLEGVVKEIEAQNVVIIRMRVWSDSVWQRGCLLIKYVRELSSRYSGDEGSDLPIKLKGL